MTSEVRGRAASSPDNDETDRYCQTFMSAPTIIVKSGWSGVVIAATALLNQFRMSSSEIPCLRALGEISTVTTLASIVHPASGGRVVVGLDELVGA